MGGRDAAVAVVAAFLAGRLVPQHAPTSPIHHLFPMPIYIVRDVGLPQKILAEAARLVVDRYDAWTPDAGDREAIDASISTQNDACRAASLPRVGRSGRTGRRRRFFRAQMRWDKTWDACGGNATCEADADARGAAWGALRGRGPAMAAVWAAVTDHAAAFVRAGALAGVDPAGGPSAAWFAVHRGGVSHPPHYHPKAALSGVLCARAASSPFLRHHCRRPRVLVRSLGTSRRRAARGNSSSPTRGGSRASARS